MGKKKKGLSRKDRIELAIEAVNALAALIAALVALFKG